MNQALAYIQFFFQSVHLHGIHSPFVYQLQQECLKDRSDHPEYTQLRQYRHALLQNKSSLYITDLGAGSKVQQNTNRAIRDIARYSSSSPFRSRLLFRLARYLKARRILELGSNLGIGTQALALSHPTAEVHSIEGSPELFEFTKEQLHAQGLKNLHLYQGSFKKLLPTLQMDAWDLIFMDGHHDKKATLGYFETLLPSIHSNTVVIVDDINWSKGMQEAWQQLKEHPKVTVSIDTFFWGLLFFRTEQAKEHFKIRV